MLKSKVLISKPYYCDEGQYTHYNKLKDMLKEDSDFFTIDKEVTGEFGGIIELYFHFDLKNEKGDTQTIYMSTKTELENGSTDGSDYWMCNGGFDSDKAWNEQPNGENYRDDSDNLHYYPLRLHRSGASTDYMWRYGRLTPDWYLMNLEHYIIIVYNENMFYYKLIPNSWYYNARDDDYGLYRSSFLVTSTNPLGSLEKGIFWGGGYSADYSLRISDKWYSVEERDNKLYQKRQVMFREAQGYMDNLYNIGSHSVAAPILLISRKNSDGDKLWSMAGGTNVQFGDKYSKERNLGNTEYMYATIVKYNNKTFLELDVGISNRDEEMCLTELEDNGVKYV